MKRFRGNPSDAYVGGTPTVQPTEHQPVIPAVQTVVSQRGAHTLQPAAPRQAATVARVNDPGHTTVEIEDDLDLAKIAESGQCFRWTAEADGSFRIIGGDACLYATDLGQGRFQFECSPEEFEATWRDYLDLDEDYRAIRARIDPEADPFLWRAAESERGIRILRQDPWETLVSFIISQNRNIPAIRRSIELLCEAAGDERMDARGRPYRAFPSPERVFRLDDAALRQCALGYRCGYVHAAAEAVLDGAIDLDGLRDAGEDETLASLTSLHGVGVKVASCVSLFGLHHLDAFPIDVWIKRVLAAEYPGGFPLERYRPYNGVCQQYLFAYYRD